MQLLQQCREILGKLLGTTACLPCWPWAKDVTPWPGDQQDQWRPQEQLWILLLCLRGCFMSDPIT